MGCKRAGAVFVWAFVGTFTLLAEDVVFRSDVSLVRVDAQVVDRDNRAITGLGTADFVLRDEGKPQPIHNFASENMPVDVLLLLDVSASMRPHIQRIAAAAHQALRVLREQDRVGIMVFDRSTRVRLALRNNRDDVEREFERLLHQETFDGGTDITRGLLDAAEYIGRQGRIDARRAIVIVTDDATERERDEAAVSRALTRADAVLCAIIAPDAMRYTHGGYGRRGGGWPGGGPTIGGGPLGGIILGRRRGPYGGPGRGGPPMGGGHHTQSAGTSEIARESGGDSMSINDASAFEDTLARIRQRYALHFYLPPGARPGAERTVEVDLSADARRRYPGAEVKYRRSYITPDVSGNAVTQASPAPARTTTAQASADSGTPQLKRRPAVNEPDGSTGWPRTDSPAKPAETPPPPDPQQQPSHGWPRVKHDDN